MFHVAPTRLIPGFSALLLLAAAPHCTPPPAEALPQVGQPAPAKGVSIDPALLAAFPALPSTFDVPDSVSTPAMVALGQKLYHDPRLSKNHDVSCNSCHDLARYGVDGLALSPGHRGQLGKRNSPTVYNAAGHMAQFWDGRSPNVKHQATQPLIGPTEMASDEPHLVALLGSMPGYVAAFKAAFPGDKKPLSLTNTGHAIGAFERQLVTPSRWDAFLAGDAAVLNDQEKRGFNTFISTGCSTCHNGALVGGQMYMKAGLVKPWPTSTDAGRFDVTHQEADRGIFKVPSLRNVAKTAPYFHDGEVSDLAAAVHRMAELQLGRDLSAADTDDIVAWLQTLTGVVPANLSAKPELPPSTAKTPKPNPA